MARVFGPSLQTLRLRNIDLEDAVAVALANGNWSRLRVIDLQSGVLNDAGAVALSRGTWPVLESLSVSNGHIYTDRMRSALREEQQSPMETGRSSRLLT